jgi:hypothetical protein
MSTVVILVLVIGVPMVFVLLAGSKDPARRARVLWQILLLGAALGFVAVITDLARGHANWSTVSSGLCAVLLVAVAIVEMRKNRQ